MFSNSLFYQSILLIIYFDNDIDFIECSLLSRAKNPINIVTEGSETVVAPVYIELPGTLQRMIPTQTAASVTRAQAPATHTVTLAIPEYIIYHNEPIRTSSPSVNIYRYETEKPSLEAENVGHYESFRTFPPLEKIYRYEPERTTSGVERASQHQSLRASSDKVDQYKPVRTFAVDINQYQPLRTSFDYVDQYKPARTSSGEENIDQYQPLRTSWDHFEQYKPVRTSAPDNVKLYKPFRTSLDNVDQYKPVKTFSAVENVNQYQPLRTSFDYVDQYKPLRTSSDEGNANQHQPLRTSLNNDDQYKPVRTFSAVENVNQYQPLRTSFDYVDQYKPAMTFTGEKNVDQYQPFRTSFDNIEQNKPVRTSAGPDKVNLYKPFRTSLDNVDQYKPLRTSSGEGNVNQYQPLRTSLNNDNQYKPVRTFSAVENVNQYQPLRTSLEYVDQYKPARTSSDIENMNQYRPLRTLMDNVDQYKPVRTWSVLENDNQQPPFRSSLNYGDQYESDRTPAVQKSVNQYQPLRTLLDNVNQYKPGRTFSPSENINYYEPVRSSPPPEEYYRYEPVRTSDLSLANYNMQGNVNRVVPVRTYPSLDNIYRYELERVSSPVKVYPYFPVRTTILEESRLPPDAYRFEPVRTSASSEYLNPYEPIKFSALYIDQPSPATKNTSLNYIYPLESLASHKDPAVRIPEMPQRTAPLMKYVHRLDHLRSTNEVLVPSRITPFTDVQKSTYQFTPFLPYRISDSMIKVKNKYQFTPYLTLETPTVSFKQGDKEFVNITKSPDEYWNEFIRANPANTRGNLYQPHHSTPSHTKSNTYKAELNTLILEGNGYPNLPFETSRAPEEYWNEFIRNEPRRTLRVKNPTRTSSVGAQLRSSKIEQTLSEDVTAEVSKLFEIFNQTTLLTPSRPMKNSYQYIPISPEDVYGGALQRTSRQENYIYQKVKRTSISPQMVYVESQSGRTLDNNLIVWPDLSKFPMTSSVFYEKLPTRTVLNPDVFQSKTTRDASVGDYSFLNRPSETSLHPLDYYRNYTSGSSQLYDTIYKNEYSVTTTPVHKVYIQDRYEQSASKMYTNQPGQAKASAESSDPPKLHTQGFRTLWQPTAKTTKSIQFLTNTEHDLKPSRTTRIFNWNFNDVDAAWPKVELVFSTTESTTAATKPKRKFATYFPFYLRTGNEESRPSSSLQNITKQTRTSAKVVKTTDSMEADHKLMLNFIQRQNTEKKKEDDVRCYNCGLNFTLIPYYPSCYHVFDTPGSLQSVNKKKYRVSCKKQSSRRSAKDYWVSGNRTLYRGGCFKRFIEFGEVYSERGCRTVEPLQGKSIVSLRLAAMERLLKHVDEGCVVSPHASLTPFARGISLFARYHVCVCKGRYCNAAEMVSPSALLTLFNIFLRIY